MAARLSILHCLKDLLFAEAAYPSWPGGAGGLEPLSLILGPGLAVGPEPLTAGWDPEPRGPGASWSQLLHHPELAPHLSPEVPP